jgi:hypothetical protein
VNLIRGRHTSPSTLYPFVSRKKLISKTNPAPASTFNTSIFNLKSFSHSFARKKLIRKTNPITIRLPEKK